MGLIFCLSSRPVPELASRLPTLFDISLAHILEYGILAAPMHDGMRKGSELTDGAARVVVFLFTAIYGITDE